MDIATNERSARIRDLNDAFRRAFVGGRVMITRGIDALPDILKVEILYIVRSYSRFDEDNDPLGEHDFGCFDLGGHRFFWKIDYYDRSCSGGSEDPSDPSITTRVLTIMLSSEY